MISLAARVTRISTLLSASGRGLYPCFRPSHNLSVAKMPSTGGNSGSPDSRPVFYFDIDNCVCLPLKNTNTMIFGVFYFQN